MMNVTNSTAVREAAATGLTFAAQNQILVAGSLGGLVLAAGFYYIRQSQQPDDDEIVRAVGFVPEEGEDLGPQELVDQLEELEEQKQREMEEQDQGPGLFERFDTAAAPLREVFNRV